MELLNVTNRAKTIPTKKIPGCWARDFLQIHYLWLKPGAMVASVCWIYRRTAVVITLVTRIREEIPVTL
jgi:hypothetical protein